MPQAAIASLRGTFGVVSSTGGGLAPTLGAQELLAAAPGLDAVAKLETEMLATLLCVSLRFDNVLRWFSHRDRAGRPDPSRIVVLQPWALTTTPPISDSFATRGSVAVAW